MATTFKFYHDASLTQEITSGNPLTATQASDGSLPAVDKTIYFGSTTAALKVQANSNPGVDQIAISIVDSAGGSGSPSTEFKLALSSGGLATAVAGDPLNIGTQRLSGVGAALPIYTRRVSALTAVGSYTDLTLQTNNLTESPSGGA